MTTPLHDDRERRCDLRRIIRNTEDDHVLSLAAIVDHLLARIAALEAAQRPLTDEANKTANDAMWQSAAKAAINPEGTI